MKKALPFLVLIVVGVAAWFFISGPGSKPSTTTAATGTNGTSDAASTDSSNSPLNDGKLGGPDGPAPLPDTTDGEDEGEDEEEIKSATELYKSSEEAMEAVKAAAKNYDDVVLEQFSDLGPNCKWCDGFYNSVTDVLLSKNTSADEKSYFAEIMAISGRVDTIKTLVDAIRTDPSAEDAEIFSDALELATGREDVTNYLGTQLEGAPDNLRESLVAALTNQSSRLAAEIMFKNIRERGDADGYYSQGIGPAEMIPDENAIPFLEQQVTKHDQYSHLAFKSLLNGGPDGLKVAIDALENSSDQEFNKRLIKDAVEHVSYDDEVEQILQKRLETAKNPVTKEFLQEAMKGFTEEAEDEEPVGGGQ